jgi:sarcosine dehydrogenase
VLALRVTYVGELGYELYMPTEYAGHVYELLWGEGYNLGVANAGYRAIESLRLEKGYRYWSADVTPDYNPYDAGLGFCVALEKEKFIGREALVKIREKGPKWKLCCFTLDTDRPMLLSGGETICYRSKVLGVVTSGVYGHTVRKVIAYGYVPVEDSNFDDGYEIEVYKEVIPATRHERTLYDPERKRILI